MSAGVASYPDGVTDVSQLVKKADQSLYEAKKTGRNCTIVYAALSY
ncbi:diguanylate cyclase domain-containing protein [Aneurinibacillus tyrosinisolvens]|nr:diguanylate cyclase [Aneurinibacillus tyrosinisolvens]